MFGGWRWPDTGTGHKARTGWHVQVQGLGIHRCILSDAACGEHKVFGDRIVNELFDEIKAQHQFKTDTQLADFLLLSKAQVCLLRAGRKLSAYTLMRLHDKTGRSVEEIRRYARQV
jgi:hypothetical protein